MGYKSVLECAKSQIGQGNGANQPNKYTRWYYGNNTVAAWCAIFMCWCFDQVGIYDRLDGIVGKAGCENWREWAVNKGIWGKTPKANAIVLFDWNKAKGDGADHIGIVESVTSSGVVSIEGNTSANGSQSNGGYVMRKTRYNADIMGYIYVDTLAPQPKPSPVIAFKRLAGANRYKTNQTVLDATGKHFTKAVVVSGEDYADALSAAHLAHQLNTPLVLTDPGGGQSVGWIKNHVKGYITLVGGTGVISTDYEEQLKAEGNEVKRLAGGNRYATNLAVLNVTKNGGGVAIVSGKGFADGVVASCLDMPVMLVGELMTYKQLAWIEAHTGSAYIIGGTGAVNGTVEAQLKELATVERIAGANRYATAANVASAFYPNTTKVLMATGQGFADGLSACNLTAAPLLLVDSSNYTCAQRFISKRNIKTAYVIGGTVPDEAANWALTKLQPTNA